MRWQTTVVQLGAMQFRNGSNATVLPGWFGSMVDVGVLRTATRRSVIFSLAQVARITLCGFLFRVRCHALQLLAAVDLLVKLSVEDDPEYTPIVTASRFLAVAEGMFGLEEKPPPD